jgi:hypothetical protein
MYKEMNPNTITALKAMNFESAAAKNFFQWAANRLNDATQTSIDYLGQRAATDRRGAIELAKQLDELGCGEFVVGRRGAKSRVVWKASLKSIGLAAIGESLQIESIDPELVAETVDLKDDAPHSSSPLTISEAKSRLAASLGVPVDSIEITVRG